MQSYWDKYKYKITKQQQPTTIKKYRYGNELDGGTYYIQQEKRYGMLQMSYDGVERQRDRQSYARPVRTKPKKKHLKNVQIEKQQTKIRRKNNWIFCTFSFYG